MSLTDSRAYGNYKNVDVYNSDRSSIIKANGTGTKLDTGITTFTKTNNIYDLAGNVYEWTQEAIANHSRACGGGCYNNNGYSSPVAYHYYNYPEKDFSTMRVSSNTDTEPLIHAVHTL